MNYSKKIQKFTDTGIILTKKQNTELKKLVKNIKENSPRMAELYKNIGENFTLQDLPITTKKMIMEDFDNWITTSDFTLKELEAFTSNPDNAGEKFKNKYIVCKTSGTTGDSFYMVYNPVESKSMQKNLKKNMEFKYVLYRPSFFVYPTNRHIISTCSVKSSHRKYPLMKKDLILQDSTASTHEIINRLNETQPMMLMTYASTAELLASEQIRGNLHLNLKEVVIGGETLSEKTRNYIRDAFHCKVRSLYACTETSGIAMDCEHNHMHLHNSSLILEPVDENNNPVPVGQQAHKLLITLLSEKTVPLIRYEINDKVTIHNTLCPCGNQAPWIKVEGRSAVPSFVFKTEHGEISVSTIIFFIMTESLNSMKRLQIILHGYDQMECRIDFMEDTDEQNTFKEIKEILTECLKKNGVNNVNIYLSDIKPQIDSKTCKFIKAYQIFG